MGIASSMRGSSPSGYIHLFAPTGSSPPPPPPELPLSTMRSYLPIDLMPLNSAGDHTAPARADAGLPSITRGSSPSGYIIAP